MTELVPYPSTQTLPAPIATPHGPGPTSTERVTRFVAGSIRASVPSPPTPTQTAPKPPASEHGPVPVSTFATTWALPPAASAATTVIIPPSTTIPLQNATIRPMTPSDPRLAGLRERGAR